MRIRKPNDQPDDAILWPETDDPLAAMGALLMALGGSGASVQLTALEVPLELFVEAEAAEKLHDLNIAVDNHGLPFLMAVVKSGNHRAIIVSVSFVPVAREADEGDGEESGGNGEEEDGEEGEEE